MRVYLVYDRRTGEPVSTFQEPDDDRPITGRFSAVKLPPELRRRCAVVEVTPPKRKTPKAPSRARSR